MKSAYELALERMEAQGIERPREEALDEATKARIADLRQRAEAKLAELEILHKDRLAKIRTYGERQQEEEDYRLERRRIEAERDRAIEKARGGS